MFSWSSDQKTCYARNEALGLLVNPDRADHRLDQLDEIEQTLTR